LRITIGNMNPQARGSISITSSDPEVPPSIDPNLLAHPYDRRVMINAVKWTLKFFNAPQIRSYTRGIVQGPKSGSEEDIIVSTNPANEPGRLLTINRNSSRVILVLCGMSMAV
jgi:choline dehydrogenase-like flavoprotein